MGATYPAPLVRIEGETLALSTTRASIGLLPENHQLILHNPVEDYRVHFNPAIVREGIVMYDASASANSRFVRTGSSVDLFHDLTDRDSGTGSGTTLDSFTTSDYLYICFSDVVGGFRINQKSANGTTNTMVVEYYNASLDIKAGFWSSLSVTDGTDTGASIAQDGDVTFTAPTDWVSTILGGPNGVLANDNTDRKFEATGVLLNDGSPGSGDTTLTVDTVDATTKFKAGDVIGWETELLLITAVVSSTSLTVIRGIEGTTAAAHADDDELFLRRRTAQFDDVPSINGFWLRISFTTAGLDSDTEIEEIHSINKDTNRGYFQAGIDYEFSLDRRNVGAIEAVVTANTDTLRITSIRTKQ